MNAEEYKVLISEKNILDSTTLNITLKELAAKREIKLVDKIKRIISVNKISKPDLHFKPYATSTTYFKVDLLSNEIETIVDMFLDLEANFLTENGETTPTASYFASLVDKWNSLL